MYIKSFQLLNVNSKLMVYFFLQLHHRRWSDGEGITIYLYTICIVTPLYIPVQKLSTLNYPRALWRHVYIERPYVMHCTISVPSDINVIYVNVYLLYASRNDLPNYTNSRYVVVALAWLNTLWAPVISLWWLVFGPKLWSNELIT